MARYTAECSVPGGYYWNPRRWSITPVDGRGGPAPRDVGRSLRAHLLGGGAPARARSWAASSWSALPFIGIGMFFHWAWTWVTGTAREGVQDLAATVTPGWRPGEVHLTGRSVDGKLEDLPAGGAGESAVKDVADEVARRRRENRDGNGKD